MFQKNTTIKPDIFVNRPTHNILYQKDSYRLFIERSFFENHQNYYPVSEDFFESNKNFDRFVDHQISDVLGPLYDHLQPQFYPHRDCEAIYLNTLHGHLMHVPIPCDLKLSRTYAIYLNQALVEITKDGMIAILHTHALVEYASA